MIRTGFEFALGASLFGLLVIIVVAIISAIDDWWTFR